ncbi:dihydrofolate reductase [Maribacter sp. 2307ULW6-5]|uniref:dihydrofolate reductase n=1 Tax=Maribacter sp. 2307ULW6-5 TaxID=3386275 RepID=UPI0039BCD833
MSTITMIAAAAENNALGKDNELLWHLPDDFKRFKKLTIGHKIIMGRKTFESFPKPLPKRTHLIITRNRDYSVDHPDCQVVHSLGEALALVEGEPAFIIGGGEIYQQGEAFADVLELTRVHAAFEADAFFPEISDTLWKLVAEEHHPKDERHAHAFTYRTYHKKDS